jgi:hypothetical protein
VADPSESPERPDIEEIFDEVFAEILKLGRAGHTRPPRESLDPNVAEAVAALRAIFEGDHPLTADLSFDQVYAKALPHFITVWKHIMREQDVD